MYIIQLAQPGFSKKTFMILISHYKGYGRITHIYIYTYIHIKKKRKKKKGKSFKLHICDVSVVKRAKKYPKKEKKQLFVMIKV